MEDTTLKYFKTEEEILTLVDGFRKRTLPAEQWTHQAHLITGLWFNYNHTEPEAVCHLRSGIITYNVSTGGENTHEKGYHETLTLFWCKVIRHFIIRNSNLTLVGLCNEFLGSAWSSKDLPLKYYTREVLFSVNARAMWVNPDRQKIIRDGSEPDFGSGTMTPGAA